MDLYEMEYLLCVTSLIIFCLLACRSDMIVFDSVTDTNIPSNKTSNWNIYHEKDETTAIGLDDRPPDCSQRQNRKTPYKQKNSHIKKCCPIGESLNMNDKNYSGSLCGASNIQLEPKLINVTLYDNCIEDMETEFTLPLVIGNPCNTTSILYNNKDDLFFIVQDGSLLVMDLFANESYDLYNNYCVDINNISGITYAMVCTTSVEENINGSQIVVVAVLTLISIPCLLLFVYLHLRIKELRSLHGIMLSCMLTCLATGYFLYLLVHVFKLDETNTGYTVQFFTLSYYFWYFFLCCNVTINIWIHILSNKNKSKLTSILYFGVYCVISFVGAFILVIVTRRKGFPGMPSYFIQAHTKSICESQRYLIPPVSTLILLSFIAMTVAFLGFRRLRAQGVRVNSNDDQSGSLCCDENSFEETQQDAKYISLAGIILLSTWLLEIVTFCSPRHQVYVLLINMMNGLQGVFLMLIFLNMRRRRTFIFRWWNDRGSHPIEKMELNLS